MLTLAVPTELGGMGATIREVSLVDRELARTAARRRSRLSMHHHVTAFTAWRCAAWPARCRGDAARVADGETVLVSTGGGDFTKPRGTAIKVDGGYRVSGRKQFASQSPVGTVMSTMFTFDDPERGPRVLNTAVPFGDGVTVHDTWNTMGMRGTASNDVTIEDVFVPDEKILADRPHGVVDPPLQVIVSIAFPIISASTSASPSRPRQPIDAVRDKADTTHGRSARSA